LDVALHKFYFYAINLYHFFGFQVVGRLPFMLGFSLFKIYFSENKTNIDFLNFLARDDLPGTYVARQSRNAIRTGRDQSNAAQRFFCSLDEDR